MCKNSVIFNIIRVVFNIVCIFYEYFNDWYEVRIFYYYEENIYSVRTSYEPYIIRVHVYTEIGLFGSYFDTHIANFL